MTATEANARAAALQADVRKHKKAVGHHRQQLRSAAAALAAFEAECRRRGIRIVLVPTSRPHQAQENIHGRSEDPADS